MLAPDQGVCTGVTVVDLPGDVIAEPLPAAVHVINGYGKSVGLMQIDELGELESPIVLTGVFGVAPVLSALVSHLLDTHPHLGDEATGRSVNATVLECNDSYLHDPRARLPGPRELLDAFDSACSGPVTQGTVGAGAGMSTFGLAGGIGTASRVVNGSQSGHVGALVMTNFGEPQDLMIAGRPVGRLLGATSIPPAGRGSVIVILATELPLSSLQLRRLCRRAQNGLARTGCVTAGGSGEVVLAFTTSRSNAGGSAHLLDQTFRAVAECVEEAVLNSCWHAEPSYGRAGRSRDTLPVLRLSEFFGNSRDGGGAEARQ
ncbi:MAG: P1 family peptidase [Actinomycetota bacterium]|nr:P1 family peptidase [Actinomycetota bacterium]